MYGKSVPGFSSQLTRHRSIWCIAALIVAACVSSCAAGGGDSLPPPVPLSLCDPEGIMVVTDLSGVKWRQIRSHGLPDHATGVFPNDGNPNSISEQCYYFRIPFRESSGLDAVPLGAPFYLELPARFGVATNGVVFDPLANDFYNPTQPKLHSFPGVPGVDLNWRYNACDPIAHTLLGLDDHNAHPQETGAYHYHGCAGIGGDKSPELIGWAFDGYPVYGNACGSPGTPGKPGVATRFHSGYQLVAARTAAPGAPPPPPLSKTVGPTTYELPLGIFDQDWVYVGGNLDSCNGHYSATAEYPDGIYHYHVTEEYPCVPRGHMYTPTEE